MYEYTSLCHPPVCLKSMLLSPQVCFGDYIRSLCARDMGIRSNVTATIYCNAGPPLTSQAYCTRSTKWLELWSTK